MSSLTETILKDLKNEKNTTFNEKKEEISIIKKRTEKIKKDLDEFNGNSQKDLNKINKTKNTVSINNLEKYVVDCYNENKNTNHINKALNHKKENKSNAISNGIKKNGNVNTNGIYKNNNINHQKDLRKEESKKINNSFSESDSVSSNSSL